MHDVSRRTLGMGFKVFKTPCKNCLLTKDKIVSDERRDELLETIKEEQSYFVCHKSSMDEEGVGEGICCKKFYDDLGHQSQLIRIAERLEQVEFIEQPDKKKLPTWEQMNKKKEL